MKPIQNQGEVYTKLAEKKRRGGGLHQNYRPQKRLPAFGKLTSTKTLTNLKNAYLLTKCPVDPNHSNARITGVLPPTTMYKNSKCIERTLFLWVKIKTRGVSSLYYLQNLQKHRTNSVFMGEN